MFGRRLALGVFVVTFAAIPAVSERSDAGPAGSDCVDGHGLLRLPDGLVLGGPSDNSAKAPYKDWLADCTLASTESTVSMEAPYPNVSSTWLDCMKTTLDSVSSAIAAGANSEDSMGPMPDNYGTRSYGLCGLAPDPTTQDDARVRRDLPGLRLAADGDSLAFTTSTYADHSAARKAGRVSAIFWGNGDADHVADRLMDGTWQSAGDPDATDNCGAPRHVMVGKGFSSLSWHVRSHDLEAEAGGENCLQDRHHMRLYATSGDFGVWGDVSLANLHWDSDWHITSSGPKSVTYLAGQADSFSTAQAKVWSPSQNAYVDLYRVN